MKSLASGQLNRYRTTPNLLTLLRICLAPFLVAAILEHHYGLSSWAVCVAGLTDALDGLLARLLKQRTMLGQYLDPVADKLLLSTLFLVLSYKGLIPMQGDGAGLRQGCGNPGGGGHFVCGHGPAGVQPQHLRQGQYPGPGGRGGCRAAASAHASPLGGGLSRWWRSMPRWR